MRDLTPWFLWLFVGVTALLTVISVPLMKGWIRLSRIYGVWTAKTLRDECIWYQGNAYGGHLLFHAGLAQLVAVVILILRADFAHRLRRLQSGLWGRDRGRNPDRGRVHPAPRPVVAAWAVDRWWTPEMVGMGVVMPRAICRCGQELDLPSDVSARVVCPKCKARVKIRRSATPGTLPDGFVRFHCPCGRRLKADASTRPTRGKCADRGRVVPVPLSPQPLASDHPKSITEGLSVADQTVLDFWSCDHLNRSANAAMAPSTIDLSAQGPDHGASLNEIGLRICPQCDLPVHLGAENCRSCGMPVPRRRQIRGFAGRGKHAAWFGDPRS